MEAAKPRPKGGSRHSEDSLRQAPRLLAGGVLLQEKVRGTLLHAVLRVWTRSQEELLIQGRHLHKRLNMVVNINEASCQILAT